MLARALTNPRFTAARTTQVWGKVDGAQLDLQGLVKALGEAADRVTDGDVSEMETLGVTQAKTLDIIFSNLARLAHANLFKHPDMAEKLLRLAFKAQSQCRATIETVAQMKNPPQLAFVKQANIANGPQQVNNGLRAREIKSQQSKLLERQHGERVDTRTADTSGGANQELEAVGAIDGAAVK